MVIRSLTLIGLSAFPILIDYSFETQGYLATVNIYDAKGRLVKTLFENELLGQEGSLKWNGITKAAGLLKRSVTSIIPLLFTTTLKASLLR